MRTRRAGACPRRFLPYSRNLRRGGSKTRPPRHDTPPGGPGGATTRRGARRPRRTHLQKTQQKADSFRCPPLCRRYLFSRSVSRQVSSAQMSLTSVFGMGTGGPSSQSTPTHFSLKRKVSKRNFNTFFSLPFSSTISHYIQFGRPCQAPKAGEKVVTRAGIEPTFAA